MRIFFLEWVACFDRFFRADLRFPSLHLPPPSAGCAAVAPSAAIPGRKSRIRMMQTAGTIHQTATAHSRQTPQALTELSSERQPEALTAASENQPHTLTESNKASRAGTIDGTETQPETVTPSKQRRKADNAQEAHQTPDGIHSTMQTDATPDGIHSVIQAATSPTERRKPYNRINGHIARRKRCRTPRRTHTESFILYRRISSGRS